MCYRNSGTDNCTCTVTTTATTLKLNAKPYVSCANAWELPLGDAVATQQKCLSLTNSAVCFLLDRIGSMCWSSLWKHAFIIATNEADSKHVVTLMEAPNSTKAKLDYDLPFRLIRARTSNKVLVKAMKAIVRNVVSMSQMSRTTPTWSLINCLSTKRHRLCCS